MSFTAVIEYCVIFQTFIFKGLAFKDINFAIYSAFKSLCKLLFVFLFILIFLSRVKTD